MKLGLLVIDVQNDYFSGGKMELNEPENALANINLLENYFNNADLPIVYIQHIKYSDNADFFAAGTKGAELHEKLQFNKKSMIVEKHFPNSFLKTNLEFYLNEFGVEQVVITGMMTHMCVDSTTRAAKEMGYNPILISDATATKELGEGSHIVEAEHVQNSFLAALANFAKVIKTSDFLNQFYG